MGKGGDKGAWVFYTMTRLYFRLWEAITCYSQLSMCTVMGCSFCTARCPPESMVLEEVILAKTKLFHQASQLGRVQRLRERTGRCRGRWHLKVLANHLIREMINCLYVSPPCNICCLGELPCSSFKVLTHTSFSTLPLSKIQLSIVNFQCFLLVFVVMIQTLVFLWNSNRAICHLKQSGNERNWVLQSGFPQFS